VQNALLKTEKNEKRKDKKEQSKILLSSFILLLRFVLCSLLFVLW
jgi:hypothetical protein